jgi:hypothetical protein
MPGHHPRRTDVSVEESVGIVKIEDLTLRKLVGRERHPSTVPREDEHGIRPHGKVAEALGNRPNGRIRDVEDAVELWIVDPPGPLRDGHIEGVSWFSGRCLRQPGKDTTKHHAYAKAPCSSASMASITGKAPLSLSTSIGLDPR